MSMTIAEKILARASGEKHVSPGDHLTAKVDLVMIHEGFAMMHQTLIKEGLPEGLPSVWDPEKVVVVLDHWSAAPTVTTANYHAILRKLAERYGIRHFYDINAGICHQVLTEKGHVLPGSLILGADSHTCTYGALNAAGAGIGNSEMAYVLSTGELWFTVPSTVKIHITGKFPDSVYSKDLILYIAGRYGIELAQYKSIEWGGPCVGEMTLASRMVMSNMSIELGAKFGLFEVDDKILDYLSTRTTHRFEPVKSDKDATYDSKFSVDVSDLEPYVTAPHSLANSKPVSELQGTPVDQAFIGSCANARYEDLEAAARVLKGHKVSSSTRLIVTPASWDVYLKAMDEGLLKIFVESGAVVTNSSCGPCMGGCNGVLAPGEKCISSSNRNFKGRMGSPEAEVYLASPATVAASSIRGRITDPREYLRAN